jgi:hypothetical protein
MEPVIVRYRARELTDKDVAFIRELVDQHYDKGRSHISRLLCQAWNWVQANGKFKEYAARDLLLRLEEQGFIALPPRLRPKNNLKAQRFDQIPLFSNKSLSGSLSDYSQPILQSVGSEDQYLCRYLLSHYHYLGVPKLVGEHHRYMATMDGQVVACLAWASAAWKVKGRDDLIGWSPETKKKKLHFVVNNTRFLILPWIRIKHLASKLLSLNLRRLCSDWESAYGHGVYLAETFVDLSRFEGTCYKASNWLYVGQTRGSRKQGNAYHYHGQPKAVYVYPLDRRFRRYMTDET